MEDIPPVKILLSYAFARTLDDDLNDHIKKLSKVIENYLQIDGRELVLRIKNRTDDREYITLEFDTMAKCNEVISLLEDLSEERQRDIIEYALWKLDQKNEQKRKEQKIKDKNKKKYT